ncbi:MAG: hypothetical protein ABSH24_30850 [Bryobacteraceae bacterium]|jgi:hypothetical protein
MLVAGAATGALWAASDPLVGKWKVNSSKSKLTDEMKVEAVGANKYAVTFGPGSVDTIVADGTDQPALQGTTLSITVDGPNNWKVVRKRDGRTLVMGIWTLSADGKSLDDDFTAYQRDGSTTKLHYVYGRTAGSSGFTGTWDSMTAEVNSSMELEIQPYEGDSLSFKGTTVGLNYNVKFDGNDYPNPSVGPGYAFSGRRINERSVEITDKVQGEIRDTRQLELSSDLKTLTIAVRLTGESKPKNVLVFDRE